MILYMDENMPAHLAAGFQLLQEPEGLRTGYPVEVRYIPKVFGRGVKDEIWIPKLGEEGACVITQDINISRRKHELELYRKHKLGAFFLRGPSRKQGLSVWQMVQALAKNWPEICRIAHEVERPFGYEFSLNRKMKKIT